jgi:hypothetical protein
VVARKQKQKKDSFALAYPRARLTGMRIRVAKRDHPLAMVLVYSYSVDQNPQSVAFQFAAHQQRLHISLAQTNHTLGDL